MTTKQTAENTQNPKRSKKHTRNNIQICTTIDPDDLTVIKKKGISVAELLRRAVNELILGNDEGYIPTKKSVPHVVLKSDGNTGNQIISVCFQNNFFSRIFERTYWFIRIG